VSRVVTSQQQPFRVKRLTGDNPGLLSPSARQYTKTSVLPLERAWIISRFKRAGPRSWPSEVGKGSTPGSQHIGIQSPQFVSISSVLLSSSVPHILQIVLKHGRTRRPWGRFHPAAHEVVSIWNQPEDSPSITYYAALGPGFSDGIMERNI